MHTRSKYLIALMAALALFPVGLDSFIVNVAIVPISRALRTDVDVVQWIVIGYLLANAAMTPLSGYLGNRFGVKRLLLLGVVLFTLFSFLCGIAVNQTWLVAFRVLQGIGGGLLLPLGAAIALSQFPEEERAKGMGAVALPILLAPVLGPVVGGLIIDHLNWQAIFFINVPVGAIALFLNWRILPDDPVQPAQARARFDYLGLALVMAGVVLVVYAFKLVSQTNPSSRTALQPEGSMYGWGYWLVWFLLSLGLALLAAFSVHSLRGDDPVVDLRLFRTRNFSLSNLAQWVQATLSFGMLFLLPVYLQELRLPTLSPLHTGLALLPMGLATIVGLGLGAWLYRLVGTRLLVAAGGALMAVASWQLGTLDPTTPIASLSPWLAVIGLSTTLLALPTQTLALQPYTGEALNKATSLVTAAKLLFGAIGPAILVTFYEQQTIWHAQRLGAAAGHAAAGALTAQARALLASQAGTSALHDVFVVLGYVSLIIVALALFLPGRQATSQEAPVQQDLPSGQAVAV